jgi:hypothetical protein
MLPAVCATMITSSPEPVRTRVSPEVLLTTLTTSFCPPVVTSRFSTPEKPIATGIKCAGLPGNAGCPANRETAPPLTV